MGSRLRHAYNRMPIDMTWDTVRNRVPSLDADARQALARLLPPDNASG